MIKVTIGGEPQKEKEIPFPKLMTYTNYFGNKSIILATSRNPKTNEYLGFCLYTECSGDEVGEYCETWVKDYADYNEPITLQNITE